MGCSSSDQIIDARDKTIGGDDSIKRQVENKDQLVATKADFVMDNLSVEDFKNNYDREKIKIGAGTFGHVWKSRHLKTGELRAIKMLDKLSMTPEEIELMK